MKNAIPLTAALLTLGGSQVNAIGCYNGGLRFSGLANVPADFIEDGITARIEGFCSDQINRDGGVTTSWNRCYNFYTNRIDMQMKWIGADPATFLSFEDCKAWFARERGGCDTGSEQNYSNSLGEWWIRIDPNEGTCS
jgi:hypothetical protein